MANSVQIDLPHALGAFGLGVILGDLSMPAQGVPGMLASGFATVMVAEFLVPGDQPPVQKEARRLFRTAPMLGFVVGYGAARYGGYSGAQSVLPAAAAAIVAAVVYKTTSRTQLNAGSALGSSGPSTPQYAAVNPSGDPPAGAGQFMFF